MKTEETLAERGKTHGDWVHQSGVSNAFKTGIRDTPMWASMSASQAEALDMIATKISRILCGNPDEPDHWRDIAGYATLAAKAIEEGK